MLHIVEITLLFFFLFSPFLILKSQNKVYKFLVTIFLITLFFLRYILNPFINEKLKILFSIIIIFFSILIFITQKKIYTFFTRFYKKNFFILSFQTITTTVIVLGTLEFSFFWLIYFNKIKLHSPIYTLKISDDIEDISVINERFKDIDTKLLTNDIDLLIKVTDNSHLIFNPVFFWEPIKGEYPYNRFGFKGELQKIKKDKDEVRIFFIGDSNTEGEDVHSFPYLLQERFENAGRNNIKVINAGVTGYTSYQGLLRFKNYILKFSPDILVVSFGWNDASTFFYGYDKNRKFPTALLHLYDHLKNYYFVKFIVSQKIKLSSQKGLDDLPRVSLQDYENNIREFVNLSQKKKFELVLLTRPYNIKQFKSEKDFRKNVSIYNDILRKISKEYKIKLIDLEKIFNEKDDRSRYFVDDCHNNYLGFELISSLLYDSLQNFLK
ncbi:MAG: GDSL-type esterase/lipase family protein [candidate division WOR-3 bacterium]